MNTRLVILSPSSEQPSSFLIVDGAGAIIGRGLLTIESRAATFKGRTILIVPGTDVVTRWLDLEDGPEARVAEAAAILLKDQLSAPLDDIHIALGSPEGDGKRAVSVVDRALMQEWIDRAAELGISADVVVPDHVSLPLPDDGVIAATLGGMVAVRGEQLAFSAEAELASILIGARSRSSIERVSEIEELLAAGSVNVSINLLQQEFAAGRGRAKWSRYRRIAALAAVAALSPLALWTAEIARNEASARGLEARAEASARAIVDDAGAADPITLLRGRLAELRANDGFMETAAALFEAVSHTPGVELEGLSYVQDGAIRATLIHRSAPDVNTLREALEKASIAVDEDASQERDGRMITTITLSKLS